MKAVTIHAYGGPEALIYEDRPDPRPRAGEVLVRVAAASINPVDVIERDGGTKAWNPFTFPRILGWDVSGTVVELGSDVHDFVVGDKVFGWGSFSYAELCVVSASVLVKVPDGIDLVEAAALPLVTITGSQLITVAAGVGRGQTVLVSGALGGVGRAAVFTALDRGADVIAVVRHHQIEEARTLGAHRVVAVDDPEAMAGVSAVDVVANTLRGKAAASLMSVLGPGGLYASVTGAPSSEQEYPDRRVVAFVSKNDASTLRYVAAGVQAKRLVIPIGLRLPLRNAADGHIAMTKGGTGKILLIP